MTLPLPMTVCSRNSHRYWRGFFPSAVTRNVTGFPAESSFVSDGATMPRLPTRLRTPKAPRLGRVCGPKQFVNSPCQATTSAIPYVGFTNTGKCFFVLSTLQRLRNISRDPGSFSVSNRHPISQLPPPISLFLSLCGLPRQLRYLHSPSGLHRVQSRVHPLRHQDVHPDPCAWRQGGRSRTCAPSRVPAPASPQDWPQ